MKYQVISPVADVREVPDPTTLRGKFETQLVRGEFFSVTEERNGWSKGLCLHDNYPGYIESRHLSKPAATPTHIVTAIRSDLYTDKTIKAPITETLSFGSFLQVTSEGEQFAQLSSGEWIHQKHISPRGSLDKNISALAGKFLETPYYWGGRSGFGLDCSGLVQVCLARAGITAERDTDKQENTVGTAVENPRAGDIVFFPGHVGIMADDNNIIHANAFHMKVTNEPLDIVSGRSGNKITAIRRL